MHNYVDSIYPSEHEIKDTTESSTSASYLDVLLNIDGKLTTQFYEERDDFDFAIVNFPYTCSNIQLSPAYGVYISKRIRYARSCSTYDQFLSRADYWQISWYYRDFYSHVWFQRFASAMTVTVNQSKFTNFHWAIPCLTFFILIVRSYLAHWLWHQITPHSWSWNRAHGRCDRSTGDAYSS
jgi:hypothetical protein